MMSLESVQQHLKQFEMDQRILILDQSSATVELAAMALHTKPECIAKTLSFMVNEQPVLVVMEGTARVDNHKYKQFFHKKAKLMSPEQLSFYVGHLPGGVCPFGVDENVHIYFDESLKKHDTVYPACGTANSAIAVSLEELCNLVAFKDWIDITKIETVEA